MSFAASWRLVLLLGPVALLVAYLVVQGARRRTVVRFTSVDLLASVAPRRTGWQRHLPAAALLAALVLLVLGFAQPVRVERNPRQRATVILTLDTSGSMVANDVAPSRIGAAEVAARAFVNALPPGVNLGLISFSTAPTTLVAPTTDRAAALAAINQLQPGGGTATGDALQLALDAIAATPVAADGKAAPAAVVLMSDGSPTIGHGDQSPTQTVEAATLRARQAKVPIHTIAFGTQDGAIVARGQLIPVPSDPAAMAKIASDTGGRTFTAQTSNQLKSVYGLIGRAVGYDTHHHEITVWFTGAALLIAMVAGVSALIWNQRLL